METWILVMAMYAGGTVTNSLSLPSTLGPMPSLDVCLDVAQSMERAGKGRIMAGCSIIITDNATTATTGGPWCPGHVMPDSIKGCSH